MSSKEESSPLSEIVKGDYAKILSEFSKILNQKYVQKAMAFNFQKISATIATSAGLALKTLQTSPIIAIADVQPQFSIKQGLKIQGQVTLNLANMQKYQKFGDQRPS